MNQRKKKAPQESEEPGLEHCETAAGMPAWRWGHDGYAYGYDSPEQEAVAKQQAMDNGRSMTALRA